MLLLVVSHVLGFFFFAIDTEYRFWNRLVVNTGLLISP